MTTRLLPVHATLAALLLAGCGRTPTSSAGAPPPRPVLATAAVARDVPLYLDEIGKCAAFEVVNILPQVSGPVVGIHFKDGAEVKKGDLLFTIDPRPYEAELGKAQALLAQDRARAAYDASQLKRNEELRQKQVSAAEELDNARQAAAVSQGAVQADMAQVLTAQINLDYCTIRSPIDGRAGSHLVDTGNIVTANSTPLVVIKRQDPIYAEFTIPEAELPRVREFIKAGTLRVQASLPDHPESTRTGAFDFIDSGVQANSGTVPMRAVFENADRFFWPGQFVNIRILLDVLKGAVLVPAEAVQIGGRGPFVFVVKEDHTVELRPVRPGQRQDDLMVISEGISPGESVVVTGQLALAPGSTVEVTEWENEH